LEGTKIKKTEQKRLNLFLAVLYGKTKTLGWGIQRLRVSISLQEGICFFTQPFQNISSFFLFGDGVRVYLKLK